MPAKPTPLQVAIDTALLAEPRRTADYACVRFPTAPPSKNATKRPVPVRGGDGQSSVGMVNTPVYRRWIRDTQHEIMMVQRPPLVRGDVIVVFRCETNRAVDVVNFVDPGCDMLQSAGVIENDQRIVDCRILWDSSVAGVMVEVWRVMPS